MEKQIDPKIIRSLRLFSEFLSAAVFAIGFFALVGWQFDISILKRVLPGLPIIAPNTAAAFFWGGIVLYIGATMKPEEKGILRIFSYAISAVILLLGSITIIEYVFGLNLGIDRMLFSSVQGEMVVRMSPQSAFNFFMMGIALFFILKGEKESIKNGQALVLLAGVVSLISLFGFIFNITSLYTIASFKGMAVHTAVAFVMVFFSILLSHPETGMMRIFVSRNPSGITARRLFVTLIFTLVMEILVAIGIRQNLFGYETEALLQLFTIALVFVYLIFFAFRSLDELGKMETSLEKSRELDRAKTEFVGLASHQLRTPLTAVSWYTEMLLGKDFGELNEKQENYLREIYAGNRRMIDLVDDLLNTSRIDMGTLKVKLKMVNLNEVMETILNEFSPQINQKSLTIEKKYGKNLPLVRLDPDLLGIVFQNIISNAVKYTPSKGRISIEVKKQNSHIQVKIADNGWGIPKHQQKKIFTKLFRADNVRKRNTDGTGLGLYIARAIVKKSRGKIWFESREGKGTTFYIIF